MLRRAGRGREIQWTVWGEEDVIRADFERAGAVVRDAARLSLEEAAVTLLTGESAGHHVRIDSEGR